MIQFQNINIIYGDWGLGIGDWGLGKIKFLLFDIINKINKKLF